LAFKIQKTESISLENPESLFRDLRQRKIQGLLSHQADVLRQYVSNAVDKPDVAVQLPTGSGKTLVGLLIGEWQRRKNKRQVIYLCPTNQLVNQVVEQANSKYGMKVRAFTGPKSEYSANSKTEYLGCEALAVTSYSSLFNISPFFSEPSIIILDDAHSADNYIYGL